MKFRPLLLILVFVLFLSSCSKDFDLSQNGKPKLSRILRYGYISSEFSYDNSDRLIKYTSYLDPTFRTMESKRYYDNNGRLIRIENAVNVSSSSTHEQMDSANNEMSYDDNNRLVETKTYHIKNGVATYVSRAVPDYDTEGRTVAVTLYEAVTNKAYVKNTYQYNTQNNIISGDYFNYNSGIQGPASHYVYEFDSYENPYKDIFVMPFGVNANNITKQTVTNYSGVPGNTTTNIGVTVFKSYNQYGYPTIKSENGIDYTYEYK